MNATRKIIGGFCKEGTKNNELKTKKLKGDLYFYVPSFFYCQNRIKYGKLIIANGD